MIFGMTQKKPKNIREVTVYKAGMTWRFGEISNHNTSWEIYDHNILST